MENTKPSVNLWYQLYNVNEVTSPSLLIYPDRVELNIKKMISMTGSADKLRPHVKTHKMPEIVRMQMDNGINKFKTSTISETEMVARCGAKDILLAIQPVGPNIERFFKLKEAFPETKIACIADSEEIIIQLSDMAVKYDIETDIWLDINNGMNRTGTSPGEDALRLIKMIRDQPKLKAAGLQVYDGHIREKNLAERKKISDNSFAPVLKLLEKLKIEGITSLSIVAGGTPTFPVHAVREGVESSPGTLLLWDYGYSSSFPDMDFLHAAVLLM
ncbi:MAG: alanine racemase, partial [Bacteroidales bacterium]|nr:alanine racemase [Bacteroidales bacterium]